MLFTWIESTFVARSVGESLSLTASLSAIHILGFTLVMGSALMVNLRSLGAVLPRLPLGEVARPAGRAILVGLAISLATGALLFSPRAASVVTGTAFQIKMLLLLSAAVFHFLVHARVARHPLPSTALLRGTAAVGLFLWMGLALSACWFILFE